MVVSLYICEIPAKVGKNILEDLFHDLEGYKEMRIKATKDRRIIAFADFNNEEDAKMAMNTFQGFKFSEEDRGLIIKFSDNSKTDFNSNRSKREKDDYYLGKKRKHSYEKNDRSSRRYRSYSRGSSHEKSPHQNSPKDNINDFKSNMGKLLSLKLIKKYFIFISFLNFN